MRVVCAAHSQMFQVQPHARVFLRSADAFVCSVHLSSSSEVCSARTSSSSMCVPLVCGSCRRRWTSGRDWRSFGRAHGHSLRW